MGPSWRVFRRARNSWTASVLGLSSAADGLLEWRAACKSKRWHGSLVTSGTAGPREVVNSQNRMNAGAEYVLYRIWAALQDEEGIHPESLLTCLGALAGYSCQMFVRQAAALPGADVNKYALRTASSLDGTMYLHGDALEGPLTRSPLSVWALVSRGVQKLGQPVPDLDHISRHVMQTLKTSAFGIPRVPGGHRPRYPAIFYLRQIWPQILPIAQRFRSKPAQLPVLFGIALQRALEETRHLLSPTLGASIAMECAIAMSRVSLAGFAVPGVALPRLAEPAVALPGVAGPGVARGSSSSPAESLLPALVAQPSSSARAKPPARRTRRGVVDSRMRGAQSNRRHWGAFIASVPPATRIVTIAALAVITVAGVIWKGDGRAVSATDAPARLEVRRAESPGVALDEPSQDLPQFTEDRPPAVEGDPLPQEPLAASPPVDLSPEELLNQENQRQLDANSDGTAEMVPPADLMPDN